MSDDEYSSDVVEFTTSEYTEMNVRSDSVSVLVDDAEMGVKVLQDGDFLGAGIGTLDDGEPYVSAFMSMTPAQAREVAAALDEAADNAEAAIEQTETGEAAQQGALQRLREVFSA